MKLNTEYLRSLLTVIEENPSPRPSLKEVLNGMGLEDLNDDFILHYEILADYGFIEGIGESSSIGLIDGFDGVDWFDANIRLTATGHEFISNLRQSEVWEAIKENFKEGSIETIFSVAKKLAEGFAKKRIKSVIDEF